jgi:CTP:molybdopterin cytidylyltransferase MocA
MLRGSTLSHVGVALASVAGLVLAAGGGRRLGGPKALLRHGDALLVERATQLLREAGCDPVLVVLGAAADEVQAKAELGDATVVVNKVWGTGVGSSLRAGLTAAEQTTADAVLVVPVDMPGLTVLAVRRVMDLPHRRALVCGTFAGRRGYPMMLGRAHWSGIATLARADVAARPYLLAHAGEITDIGCDRVAEPDDVDTPEDAARWGMS